jgi:hypothetical protein
MRRNLRAVARAVARAIAPGLAAALMLALALRSAGCTPEICARNSDCPAGLVCLPAGNCGPPGSASDAGVDPDADAPVLEIP